MPKCWKAKPLRRISLATIAKRLDKPEDRITECYLAILDHLKLEPKDSQTDEIAGHLTTALAEIDKAISKTKGLISFASA